MKGSPIETINAIAQIIYDKKGSNILAVEVKGLSSLTDYLIIAEGNVDRHVSSMASTIIKELKKAGGPPLLHSEGLRTGDWVVLDYGDVTVHLFQPNLRERYSLERLWAESKLVDLTIDTSNRAVGDSD